MKYLSHEVNGLLPGVRYQFQVANPVSCRFFICDGDAGAVKSWDYNLRRLDKSYISHGVFVGLQAILLALLMMSQLEQSRHVTTHSTRTLSNHFLNIPEGKAKKRSTLLTFNPYIILSSRTLQRKKSSRKFPQQILQPPPEIGPFCRSIPSPTPAAAAPWATCLRCPARPRPRHVGMAPPHGAWAPSGPSQRHHRDWRVWHLLVWRLGGKGEGRRLCGWFDVVFNILWRFGGG